MISTFQPVAIITEVAPRLALWVLGISFFVTLAIVALLSKGRRWYELACMFLVFFVVAAVLGVGICNWGLEIAVVQFEVVSLR